MYAVLDENGNLVTVTDDIAAAAEDAYRDGGDEIYLDTVNVPGASADYSRPESNPAEAMSLRAAEKVTRPDGTPIYIGPDALKMPLSTALRRLEETYMEHLDLAIAQADQSEADLITLTRELRKSAEAKLQRRIPMTPEEKAARRRWEGAPRPKKPLGDQLRKNRPWRDFDSARDFIFRNNMKMNKKEHGVRLTVTGIPFVPYWQYAEHEQPFGLGRDHVGSGYNLCVGSSPSCRRSCLVYSGQNISTSYTILSKFILTHAFLNAPEAFGRMMHEVMTRYLTRARVAHAYRLNVLSDIPWEVIFPSFFFANPDVQLYDYTKVAHRVNPPNYDLTFSYSGVNMRMVESEISRGRRIAVVVVTPGAAKSTGEKLPGQKVEYPSSIRVRGQKVPVVDGDKHDARFLDPPGSVVLLHWKPPSTTEGTATYQAERVKPLNKRFIVEVEELGGLLVAPVTPSEQPDTTIRTVFSESELSLEKLIAKEREVYSRKSGRRRNPPKVRDVRKIREPAYDVPLRGLSRKSKIW